LLAYLLGFFFFFQAEDGIRDFHVTGVQTCALPIFQDWLFWDIPHSKRPAKCLHLRSKNECIMWVVYALLSALFAALTAIFSKIEIGRASCRERVYMRKRNG